MGMSKKEIKENRHITKHVLGYMPKAVVSEFLLGKRKDSQRNDKISKKSDYSAAGVSVAGASALEDFLLRRVRPAFLAAFSLSMFSL